MPVIITRRGWTLRRRLVVGIVALLAAVSVIIGTVSVLALQSSLMTQLDSQVSEAAERNQQTEWAQLLAEVFGASVAAL